MNVEHPTETHYMVSSQKNVVVLTLVQRKHLFNLRNSWIKLFLQNKQSGALNIFQLWFTTQIMTMNRP